MTAMVDLHDVKLVSPNPCNFETDFEFEITFECSDKLKSDLEWKLTYVGSAEDVTKDQILEEVCVGPIPPGKFHSPCALPEKACGVGTSKFTFTSPPPRFTDIPEEDILGVTVVSITCSYKDQPFINVGYYVRRSLPRGSRPRQASS